MKTLSIDTTSMRGSIALSDGRRLVLQRQQADPRTYSTVLMPIIDGLLAETGWVKESIEAIAVAVGPGSFTGLRIGLAAAKGLSLGLGVPVVGVSSLRSLAMNGEGLSDTVAPLIDARRGEIYMACYRFALSLRGAPHDGATKQSHGDRGIASSQKSGLAMTTVIDECVLPPEAVVERLRAIDGKIAVTGDGVIVYRELLTAGLAGNLIIPAQEFILPRAHNLAVLAAERFENGESDDLTALAPNYIRHSDAEIGFLGRGFLER